MDDLWVCYEQLGYGVILIFRDWIRRFVPLFSGRWEKCSTFPRTVCRRRALIWSVVGTKRRNIWKRENIFFRKRDNRPTFRRTTTQVFPYPFRGSVADLLRMFRSRASLSLYYRSPGGAATEPTQRCCGEWLDSSGCADAHDAVLAFIVHNSSYLSPLTPTLTSGYTDKDRPNRKVKS